MQGETQTIEPACKHLSTGEAGDLLTGFASVSASSYSMPIIINEIEIAVEVTSDGNGQNITSSQVLAASKEEIVKECIEKIMEIIKQKSED